MTIGRYELVALDGPDIGKLQSFYADLTGWKISRTDDDWKSIESPDGDEIAFQLAPDHQPPQWPGQEHPQQFHLDFQIDGIEEAAARAEGLGATRAATGASWITLLDPAGHPFDVCQAEGVGPVLKLFAVTIDAPDPSALAPFYAELLGMEVTYDGPEGALLAGDGKSVMFQKIGQYTAPQWPDPAHPQQAHLDVLVDDLDEGEAAVVKLGATKLDGAPEGFRVFADPIGHPFCLTTP